MGAPAATAGTGGWVRGPTRAKSPPYANNTTTAIHHNDNDNKEDRPRPSCSSSGSTLPLFVPDHPTPPHHQPPSKPHTYPRMWSYFSVAQWQELELEALIYRYMLSGAAVPPELLHPIKKTLAHQPPSFFHHHHQQQLHPHVECFLHHPQSQPFRFQAGYWGSASMDPEPGRCRRTDGKKWRCSRDVVPGQKFCERLVHRGRIRSRKPVKSPRLPEPMLLLQLLVGVFVLPAVAI